MSTCITCSSEFAFTRDPDSFDAAQSTLRESKCVCGDLICCQICEEEQARCAECRVILCDRDGGCDFNGERYCLTHLPEPQIPHYEIARATDPFAMLAYIMSKHADAILAFASVVEAVA
jgi:hypothetical protein